MKCLNLSSRVAEATLIKLAKDVAQDKAWNCERLYDFDAKSQNLKDYIVRILAM